MAAIQTATFSSLAEVYQTAGLAEYAEALAPRLLDLAFELDWTGRTLLDLGSGTGELGAWFARRDFRTIGIDLAPAMIKIAEDRSVQTRTDATFSVADLRSYHPPMGFEIVTCVGSTLNYLTGLRELESAFRTAAHCTMDKKLFFFDLYTIEGLAKLHGNHIFANNDHAYLASHDEFNYETLTLAREYTIFYPITAGWHRATERHTLRGYPIQSISKMLHAHGFRLLRTLTPDLHAVESSQDVPILLFVAQRDTSLA